MKKEAGKNEFLDELRRRSSQNASIFGRFSEALAKRRERAYQRKILLKQKIDKAGLAVSPSRVSRGLFIFCVVINLFITFFAVQRFYADISYNFVFLFVLLVFVWVFMFCVVLFVTWFLFYVGLDLAIFQRKQKLEEVLPDFLQLASSNIRAGMTIDQSLWFAVRPRFGVLANEIQEVAKRTFAGEPLDSALTHFVKKYDSKVLERSINLLIEGLSAGGEMGALMNKIASNIQETNLMKKEMAANVTTYIIFITFATVVAAPFLFGMAYQLIIVIQEVFSRVDINPGATSGMPLSISKGVISTNDFMIFAIVSLIITSFFSAIIVSAIKKGNITGGIKYIPIFIISSITLFLIVVKIFSMFVGGFF